MQQEVAFVTRVSVYDALPSFYQVQLKASSLIVNMKPGQFVLASTDFEYVRRPFFPIELTNDGFSLLIPLESALRRLGLGDDVDCIAPLGNGFPLPRSATNLLLVAQARGYGVGDRQNGVSLLLTLIDYALKVHSNVLLVYEATSAPQLFPPAALPPGVEVRLATLDGSRGHAGTALDLLPELAQWADQVCAVGHTDWYTELVAVLRKHRLRFTRGFAWGLIAPEIMPCGMGVCGGCAIETRDSYRLACTDGPVFDLMTI
jgi:dihydroorotate dehydrogenase electron transfer subunit